MLCLNNRAFSKRYIHLCTHRVGNGMKDTDIDIIWTLLVRNHAHETYNFHPIGCDLPREFVMLIVEWNCPDPWIQRAANQSFSDTIVCQIIVIFNIALLLNLNLIFNTYPITWGCQSSSMISIDHSNSSEMSKIDCDWISVNGVVILGGFLRL